MAIITRLEKMTDHDHLRTAIIARAAKLGMTAYAIARDAGGPSKDAVRRYMAGETDLKSSYVAAVCRVLGLELTAAKKKRNAR